MVPVENCVLVCIGICKVVALCNAYTIYLYLSEFLLLHMLFIQSPEPTPRNYSILLIVEPDHDDASVVESLRPTILNDSTTVKSIRVTAYVYHVWPVNSIHVKTAKVKRVRPLLY